MSRDDYWQESFECAFADAGLWHVIEAMTAEQRAQIGGSLAVSAECQSLAFPTPENPLKSENDRLERKLKWAREVEGCHTCSGSGRLRYRSGPWFVDTGCHVCHGEGKVHPRKEMEPT